MIKIGASTNPPLQHELLPYMQELQNYGVDYVHCDVMDGHFVENKCLSNYDIKDLSFKTLLMMDVHLMVENPKFYLPLLYENKVNYITVHYESFSTVEELVEVLKDIQDHGILAGVSLKPQTSVDVLTPEILQYVNLVMVMSVEPGKSGQKFIPNTLIKFEKLNKLRIKTGLNFKIQADGGVGEDNIVQLAKVGVDIVVIGSALYGAKNKKDFINKIKTMSVLK